MSSETNPWQTKGDLESEVLVDLLCCLSSNFLFFFLGFASTSSDSHKGHQVYNGDRPIRWQRQHVIWIIAWNQIVAFQKTIKRLNVVQVHHACGGIRQESKQVNASSILPRHTQ